ncbi:hypothetical protein [Palleronia pelagia]|uniref:Nucleotide-diphospho-sugar transferase n=1 Tax=Palleronia pelagia TaxID=387096 RepID=A0A1H8GLL7_9RHOB|nr:hypothetical protein [Palleronia pelagia]SEN44853.1 hypothetical protein SAMN04488011_104128 [Palleronia pelagia]
MTRPKLTFAYIVEPPEYQTLACTLLASIRSFFGPEVAAIGYCPAHRMDELHPAIFKAHEIMGAEIRPMVTEGMWDEPYPHGNKIIAAMQPRDSEYSAFVDSDVLFLRDNTPENILKPGHVSCSVAASMVWAEQDIWDTIYGALDMPIPDERIEYMRRPVGPVIPYFSAGLVSFPESPSSGERFPDVWYDTARRLDRLTHLENRRPYLDQMSLPPAIRRAGLDWNILPEEQHYILGGRIRGEPLPEDREIFTIHYRKTGILKELGLHKFARGLLGEHTGVSFVRRLTEAPEKIKG